MKDGILLHRTRAFCCDCQELHPAELRVAAGGVRLELLCPAGRRGARVSSDAALFAAIRGRSALPAPPLEAVRGFSWINFLEITRDCNCTCPVCYAGSRPGAGGTLTTAEVARVATRLRAEGLLALTLTGGEPTLHPDLPAIIAAVRRTGLDVTLVSNGLRLGEDPDLARQLRRSGLIHLYLQLDTLREAVCRRLRGDGQVALRRRALEHARAARLRFGLDVTVIQDNLKEVGALLQEATRHAPLLGLVTYLAAGRTGRFQLEEDALVTREEIIHALVDSGAVEGLTTAHFWPFPRFAPLGLDVHPDCGVLLPLALDRGRLRPLADYLDLAGVFHRMAAARGGINRPLAFLRLSWYLLRAVRPARALPLARMLLGLIGGRGRSSFLTVVVEQFLDGEIQDEERLERCTTCSVLRDGRRVPHCAFQHRDPRRSGDTRVAVMAQEERS